MAIGFFLKITLIWQKKSFLYFHSLLALYPLTFFPKFFAADAAWENTLARIHTVENAYFSISVRVKRDRDANSHSIASRISNQSLKHTYTHVLESIAIIRILLLDKLRQLNPH